MADPRCANLWAITCYFNPVGYRRRLENYYIFRQRLKVPLVTVELSCDEKFQLGSSDADILVQVHSPAILWQKERLLNVALGSLPDGCDKVAWLDCDVLFENDDWVERSSRALDEFSLLHLFQERIELPMDFTPNKPDSCVAAQKTQSVVYQLAAGEIAAEEACLPGGVPRGSTCGLAWASRRDLLSKYGLYDACIVGSGNIAIFSAAVGLFDQFAKTVEMNERRMKHYQAWARPFFNRIRGRVGYIPGRVFHLWHGDLSNRGYPKRHGLFARFDFDPFTDIAVDPNGCWRWNSKKTEMQEFVRHYFKSRKEDGV